MPPPPKIRRTMQQYQEIRPIPAALILPNSVPSSTEGFSGPGQNVTVSQATTSENTDVNLPQNTDTTSNNTGTIFPTADNDSLAESIVQCLLQSDGLIPRVLQSLNNCSLKDVYTNNTSMVRVTNANGTLTSLGSHNLQPSPSFNQSIPSYPQPHDNQMNSQENISSTTLHQHGVVNQVQSFISSQPDFPGTSALEQHYPSDNTNISPLLSSTSNVSQPTMDIDPDQQLQDLTGGIDSNVLETSQVSFR